MEIETGGHNLKCSFVTFNDKSVAFQAIFYIVSNNGKLKAKLQKRG